MMSKQIYCSCTRLFERIASIFECGTFNPKLCGTFLHGSLPRQLSTSAKHRQCSGAQFAREHSGSFTQKLPVLGNQYSSDPLLQSILKNQVPEEFYRAISTDLERFGSRVATDLYELHLECEENPPRLEPYDAWGHRVDRLVTCEAWKKMHDVSAEEGLISIPYENEGGRYSRVYQVAKLYLYGSSSGLYSCPLAMTDGAASILKPFRDVNPRFSKAYDRLTSRDPTQFWTSGQWMTERRGGSDVAHSTETVAIPQADGSHKLFGYKWFSSATDSDMTMTLARVQDGDGHLVPGTKGLSLFYLETYNPDGTRNNIQISRLKKKLGTRQLPTAELILDGTTAYKLSDDGRGIPGISQMLTRTRIYNTVMSVSAMRRMVNMAVSYATNRYAFGQMIINHPLHRQTLARLEIKTRAATLLMMELAILLGFEENGIASEDQLHLLRLLTPIAKLYTAKQAVSVTSEGLECFGGQGYMEDTGLPSIFRDAQGTIKVLEFVEQNGHDKGVMEVAGRDLAFSLARLYMGALLLEQASHENASRQDVITAVRWCGEDLAPVVTHNDHGYYTGAASNNDAELLQTLHSE